MSSQRVTLAAIIVTYNRPAYLERCLSAVIAQSREADHIIVVDNCSDPPTAEMIARFDDPRIVTACIEPNIGSAGAVNVGIAAARQLGATHVWMGDDDCQPAPDCFARLLAPLLADQLDVATSLVYADDGSGDLTYPWMVDGVISYDSKLVLRSGLDIVNKFPSFWGMAMAPISLFDRLGPLKAECFIWGDEIEYSQRIKKAGLRFAIADGAIAYHPRWKGSPVQWRPFGEFPISPADRLTILYRNRAMWTRDEKGFLRGLARAVFDGLFFFVVRRDPLLALRIWAYGFDGLLNTYALPPSRTRLRRYRYALVARDGARVEPLIAAE